MTPRQLLVALHACGATVTVGTRGELRIEPASAVPSDLADAARQQKDALVAELRRPTTQAAPAVTPADYPSLGLYVLNGVVTHALGDQFAADVIAGRVSRATALEMQQTAERTKRALRNAKPWRI
jgi:hypothetical protein